MASTKEYLDFVMEQLSGLDEVSSRAMMGEYIIYYRGRIFGGVYDDRLWVKPVPMALRLMPDAEMEQPYHGAKEMILVDSEDSIPKNRKCEYTNKAQTRVVWAFSNFVRTLRTTICKKSINTLRQIMDRIFHKTDCATLTIFGGMYSLASVTTWQFFM